MAKTKDNSENSSSKNILTYAGILLAVVVLASFVMVTIYHSSSNTTYNNANNATYYLRQINEELLMVNRNVLMIISDAGNAEELAQSIDNSFSNIEFYKEQYASIGGRSDRELYRYNQAVTFINAYKKKFDATRNNLSSLDTALYIQEIHPLQTTASEMFNATIDINSENTQEQLRKISILFRAIQIFMIALLLLGEAAIAFAARMLKQQDEMLKKREREFAEIQAKLSVSTRDTSKLSKTNVLTGLKNRYALSDDLINKNARGDVDFAIFNVDNFRFINETYGYEYGDEYLHLVADALKKEFEGHAEIYNYTSNSFALLFDSGMNKAAAANAANKALEIFSRSYTAATIAMQLTATGCFAHFEANSIRDINKVLIQMETVMRQTKDAGGNKLVKLN